MKCASVYLRQRQLLVLPSSQAVSGMWLDHDPVAKLGEIASDEDVGQVILDAVSASRQDVPDAVDPNARMSSLLEIAGARSWATFERSAKAVRVELDNECLRFCPSRTLRGSDTGFAPLDSNKDVALPSNATANEIGAALREAFSRCQ